MKMLTLKNNLLTNKEVDRLRKWNKEKYKKIKNKLKIVNSLK